MPPLQRLHGKLSVFYHIVTCHTLKSNKILFCQNCLEQKGTLCKLFTQLMVCSALNCRFVIWRTLLRPKVFRPLSITPHSLRRFGSFEFRFAFEFTLLFRSPCCLLAVLHRNVLVKYEIYSDELFSLRVIIKHSRQEWASIKPVF